MKWFRRLVGNWLGMDVLHSRLTVQQKQIKSLQDDYQDVAGELREFKEALERQAAKASVFDRDKLPANEATRYVPIARRRAMAERQSLGPVTHDDKVRANNARAMES